MNNQISIIGCGWLGLPLAKKFINKGFKVKGTTTSKDKLSILTELDINAYYLKINSDNVNGNVQDALSGCDVLVLNIPPGLRNNSEENYVAKIKYLIPHIEASKIKKVLFVSSTSVYADEEALPKITEHTKPNPNTESGRQLLKAEELLQKSQHFKTTIVRFSGLFGNNRHPAKQLSGKTNLKNADAPVNLIHLTDATSIIEKIIEQDVFGETFNASSSPHPTKQFYYTSVCKSMEIPLPQYDLSNINKGKIILSDKLEQLLNYEFKIKL